MRTKKIFALAAAVLAIAGSGALITHASTSYQGDSNRTWTYGKNTSTSAESNLLDNVATHESSVLNDSTNAFSDSFDIPVRNTSYARVPATSSDLMYYSCSVAYWSSVLSTN